jgi:hypothetical protein
VAEVIKGAAKPVGSDGEGTVRIADAARAERDTHGADRAAKRRPARPRAVPG